MERRSGSIRRSDCSYPLKRIGAKGEGKFQRIGWDEAIAIIADKLKEQKARYGPESLGILSPARRSYSDYLYRFLMTHGSPNYGHSGICCAAAYVHLHVHAGRAHARTTTMPI